MRTIALVCAFVVVSGLASQQEPAPMVLTFDKFPDDGTCTAAYRIAAEIRIEDAQAKGSNTIRFCESARAGQVRIEINLRFTR